MVLSQESAKATASATAIHHYDVVIIGGGIAGIAIAELLARKTDLCIKLIDHARQLGTGASGKLEGWFHSGALYSGNDDAQIFMNCVNGIEDLINYYSSYFAEQCNIVLEERYHHLFVPTVRHHEGGWFNDAPVLYILPDQGSLDIRLSRFKNDSVLWEIQRQRVRNRLEAAFGLHHNWLQDGQCRAPSYAHIESYRDGRCSLNETSGILDEVCRRYDKSFGLPASSYEIIQSLDVSMNTATILRDLVASALSKGVDFETGITVENLVLDRFGPTRIKSVLCRDRHGVAHLLKAKLFIFAVGADFKILLQQLHLRVRLKMSKSAMVIAAPALATVNFARMSIREKFHFNHFVQQVHDPKESFQYSILANSGFSPEDADVERDVADVDNLLEPAERYFGKKELYLRRLYSYDCIKTEFISEEEEQRRYSYWIELNKDSNYISVLPGKFSFFPTVAYQTYLRVRDLLECQEACNYGRYIPHWENERRVHDLVAEHHAVRILSEERSGQ